MKKLLIIDDDETNVDIIKELFETEYECEAAYGGIEGLAKYLLYRPDVILLDIMMPDIDGKDVLEAIRLDEEKKGVNLGKGIPVIMMTAKRSDYFDSFRKGCDHYMVKPFDLEQLVEKVQEVLKDSVYQS